MENLKIKIGDKVRTVGLPEKVKAYRKPDQPMIANPWLDIEGVVVHSQEGDIRVKFDIGTEAFQEKNLIKTSQ